MFLNICIIHDVPKGPSSDHRSGAHILTIALLDVICVSEGRGQGGQVPFFAPPPPLSGPFMLFSWQVTSLFSAERPTPTRHTA